MNRYRFALSSSCLAAVVALAEPPRKAEPEWAQPLLKELKLTPATAQLDPNRWTAIFITLHFAGLRRPDQWEAVLVVASLAPVLAEAHAHSPGAFKQYPMDLPQFVYEEDC